METVTEITPEDAVYRIASRLIAIQHAVAEIAGGRKVDADPRALQDAVFQIRAALKAIDGAYGVFIGGLAVQHHGYERYTDDVDIVVDRQHFSQILDKLRTIGFVLEPNYVLRNKQTGVKLDLLQEGTLLKDSRIPLPHPSDLGKNGFFVTLQGLVRLKLDAPREKDKADIVEVLKRNLSQGDGITDQLPESQRSDYVELLAKARREFERYGT